MHKNELQEKNLIWIIVMILVVIMLVCDSLESVLSQKEKQIENEAISTVETSIAESVEEKVELSEEEYKAQCVWLNYDIFSTWSKEEGLFAKPGSRYIGQDVHFRFAYWGANSERNEYYGAEESRLSTNGTHQLIYFYDKRTDKSLPLVRNMVIDVYGQVTDVVSGHGGSCPVIDAKYIDYAKMVGDSWDEITDLDSVIEKYNIEQEEKKQEEIRIRTENSDLTSISKNVPDMDSLGEKEFKESCDQINYYNVKNTSVKLPGRFVKIHAQLDQRKIYTGEISLEEKVLGEQAIKYELNKSLWTYCLYREARNDYIDAGSNYLFFLNDSKVNPEKLKKNQKVVVYGMILDDFEQDSGWSDEHFTMNLLVFYIENEK